MKSAAALATVFVISISQTAFASSLKYSADRVNFRSEPSTDALVLKTLNAGESLIVAKENNGWMQVTVDGVTGYVKSDYISDTEPPLIIPNVLAEKYLSDNVNFRTLPSLDSEVIETLGTGKKVAVVNVIGDWSQINADGNIGYIKTEFLVNELPLALRSPTVYQYTSKRVNFRKNPSLESEIITVINIGESVGVLDTASDWLAVKYNGEVGYVKSEFIQNSPPPVDAYDLIVQTTKYTNSRVNLRPFANTDCEVIKVIDAGQSVGFILTSGEWSLVKSDNDYGWLKTEYIAATVAASASSVQSYYRAPVKMNGVELLSWREAADVFTIGVDAAVYDVWSGATYYVRSFSNGNHADVEPVTVQDTAILKQTYGGIWSWDPRPVWVTINGRTMAAAINGMPHASGVNDSNGMDGQVCIHFQSSTTHNGNTSYAATFQNAVQQAWAAAQ